MAQLAPVIEKLEDVAEPARQFYVPKDGKFHVDLSGTPAGFASAVDLAAANAKVVEFRDKNVALLQEIDPLRKLKTDIGDLDIVAAKTAHTELAEIKKKGVGKADDVTKLVADGIAAALKPVTDELATERAARKSDRERADALTLRSSLGDVFTKAGGVAEATDFIANKAAGVFKVVEGKVVAEANQFSADKPGEPLSIGEWMTRMTKENAFAFKPSSGSGADPAKTSSATARPGVLILKDPSPQMLGQYGKEIKDGKMRVEYSENNK